VNHYQRHIGDFLRDAGHLDFVHRGAYETLLDVYYSREGPIPEADAVRLSRARTPTERAATQSVLEEFFRLVDGMWQHKRCEEEIACYLSKSGKARRAANLRWEESSKRNASALQTKSEGNATRARVHKPVPSTHIAGVPDGPPAVDSAESAADGRPQLSLVPPVQALPDCPHQQLIALYQKHLPGHRQPARWDGERMEAMRQRWRECSRPTSFGDGYATLADGIAFWDKFFAHVAATRKLRDGITSNERGEARTWRPSLDWLVQRGNFTKVIEGAYT
jgi:uncharacterized protein YdaU (DUF1376 family)